MVEERVDDTIILKNLFLDDFNYKIKGFKHASKSEMA